MKSSPADGERDVKRGAPDYGGLCPSCRHVRTVVSDRGSRFLLCGLSKTDPAYHRYPPQPVLVCRGWER